MKEFEKMAVQGDISGREAFLLFQSYGFPLEMTEELADEKKIKVNVQEFLTEFQIKYNSFTDDEVRQILKNGADKIRPVAEETLKKVKEKLGIN